MLHIHSFWAYLVVVFAVIATLNAIFGSVKKRPFESRDFSLSLITLIVTHVQFLLGVILLAMNNQFGEIPMGDIMKSAALRLTHIEHPTVMLLAAVFITIGYSKHKKQLTSEKKFKVLSIFYTIALILILSRIPWANWI